MSLTALLSALRLAALSATNNLSDSTRHLEANSAKQPLFVVRSASMFDLC
jgi:hypothetical protein